MHTGHRFHFLFLLALGATAACSPITSTGGIDTDTTDRHLDCVDGRCDGFTRPTDLAAIPLDAIATCTSEVDLADTTFAAADRISCTFEVPEALRGARV